MDLDVGDRGSYIFLQLRFLKTFLHVLVHIFAGMPTSLAVQLLGSLKHVLAIITDAKVSSKV